jgi:hypothetical protein
LMRFRKDMLSLHRARKSVATAKPLWPCRLVSWPGKPVQNRLLDGRK